MLGNIDKVLKQTLDDLPALDFAFVDANHRKEAVLRYFDLLLEKSHDDTVLVFDDIYWSGGMRAAWNTIRHNPAVTLSIDLYQFGLVFFNPDIRKQHVTLWY